jgi:hypothetical protein
VPLNTRPKSVFKAIKAIKRRGVESIFQVQMVSRIRVKAHASISVACLTTFIWVLAQKIGASEATVDQDYDEAKRRFDRTIRELNELGAVRVHTKHMHVRLTSDVEGFIRDVNHRAWRRTWSAAGTCSPPAQTSQRCENFGVKPFACIWRPVHDRNSTHLMPADAYDAPYTVRIPSYAPVSWTENECLVGSLGDV